MSVRKRFAWFLMVSLIAASGCKDRENTSQAPATNRTGRSTTEAEVCGVVADVLGVKAEEVSPDMTFAELHADELDVVEIIMELEDKYETAISDEALEREAGGSQLADLTKTLKVSSLIKLVTEAREAKLKATRPSD
jgi:acyl carrier protein